MSQIEIPRSLREYFFDPAIQTATDALVNSKNNQMTLADSWENLPNEFDSYIAAQQIKADYIHTLWIIWEAVWKPVLAKHNLNTNDFLSLEQLYSDGESNSSISEVWDRYPLQRIYRRESKEQFNFGVDFGGQNNGVRLLCWLISKEQTEKLNLGVSWLENLIDAEWRVTKSFQLKRDEDHLRIDDLILCAEEAAEQMLKQ